MTDALAPQPGERVADIGCGPGFLALEIGNAVGPGGRVWGVDLSEPMLALARERCARLPWIALEAADATALPFPDEEFDAAVSVQVYEYVPAVERAVSELFRILKSGGRAVIMATDWDSILWHSGNPERMRCVLSAWDEHLHDPRLPRSIRALLRNAGFVVGETSVVPQLNPAYDENTYSVGLIPLIQAFVAGRRGVSADEAADWVADLRTLGERGEYFFCLNQYLFTATKPAA